MRCGHMHLCVKNFFCVTNIFLNILHFSRSFISSDALTSTLKASSSLSSTYEWVSLRRLKPEIPFSRSVTPIFDDLESNFEVEDEEPPIMELQIFQAHYSDFSDHKKIRKESTLSLDSSLAPSLTDSVSIKPALIELDPDTPLPELQKYLRKRTFAFILSWTASLEIMQHIAFVPMQEQDKDPPSYIIDERLARFLIYFYESRDYPQDTHFHWYINEGFFAADMLTKHPSYRDKVLPKSEEPYCAAKIQAAHDYLMKRRYSYVKKYNVLSAPLPWTGLLSYYLLTGYIRMLLEGVTHSDRPILERRLLRARFAAHVLEHYIEQNDKAGSTEPICSKDLFDWSLLHESRLHLLLDEPLHLAQERAVINMSKKTHICTPNIEEYREYYKNDVLTRPDALAINPHQTGVRKYDMPNLQLPSVAICPVKGCDVGICERNFMSHFVTQHCGRWSELYQLHRLIYGFYSRFYTPEQIFCLFVLRLHNSYWLI